jgi:hypothetical protein
MPSRLKLTPAKRITMRLGIGVLVVALLGGYSSTNAVLPEGGTVFFVQPTATLYAVPGVIVGGDADWIVKHAAWTDGHAAWAG